MKTSNHLPIECRQEIEDKLLVVRKHWKDAGKFATDAFSGWLYALDWVLNNELSEPKESNEPKTQCLVVECVHQADRRCQWRPNIIRLTNGHFECTNFERRFRPSPGGD